MELGVVEIWCLDEDGGRRIVNVGQPGFFLRYEDITVLGPPKGPRETKAIEKGVGIGMGMHDVNSSLSETAGLARFVYARTA